MLIVTIVLPIFAIMLCGFLAGRFALLPVSGSGALTSFVYYFALPALLFLSLAEAPVGQIANVNFIAVNVLSVVICFLAAVLIFHFIFHKSFPDIVLYGMGSTYGNTGFLGIPFLITAFGQEAAVPAAVATFIYDLLLLSVVIISFQVAHAPVKNKGQAVGSVAKAVLLNPINASLLLGIMVALFRLPLPEPVYVFTDILGAAAGPTALFALGLSLVNENRTYKVHAFPGSEIGTILGLKLLFQPLVAACLIFFIFPLNELRTVTVVLLTAMPTGVLLYVFAEKYRTFTRQASLIVLLSTVISIFTLSILLVFIGML